MKSVDILLYEGVDEFDFAGAYEVLASCRKLIDGRWTEKLAFRVETVADTRATIRTAHGMNVLPDKSLAQAFEADIIVVPGGPGASKEHVSEHILEFLRKASYTADVVASISTGAFLVARAGLAFQHELTTHYARTGDLARMYPLTQVIEGKRVVVSGADESLMSSGGSSCGIDIALALIARFEGDDTARIAARRIEWPLPVARWSDLSKHGAATFVQREHVRL